MVSDYDDSLLNQGFINFKAKDFVLARHYLELALELADDTETRVKANYLMSQIATDPLEKRKYLEETILNDPTHPEAHRDLAVLDGKLKPGEIVNPDRFARQIDPVQVAGAEQSQADRFTCPKCGGRMVFDGDGRTLICEYCSRNQSLSRAVPQFEQDFVIAMATGKGHRTPVTVKTFNCQGCGAHFILSAQQISAVCAYCGSAHVVALTKELVEPDSVIPMSINQPQAEQLLLNWIGKNKLTPDGRLKEPRGFYLPVWTFDVMGVIPWNGTVYRDKQQVPVSGEENVSFGDILVPGVSRLSDILPKIFPGFDTANAPAYDEHFLAGWPAEVYELSMSDASLEARQRVVERIRVRIHDEKGQVNGLNYSTANLSILSFKLVLIPLWNSLYSYQGQDYRVIINGQNGMVYGETKKQGIMHWLEGVLGE